MSKRASKHAKTLESANECKSQNSASRMLLSSGRGRKKDSTKRSNIPKQSESAECDFSKNGPAVSSEPFAIKMKLPKARNQRKQYLCSECGRQLKTKSSLDIHVRSCYLHSAMYLYIIVLANFNHPMYICTWFTNNNYNNQGTGIRGLIRGMATLPKVTRSY